MTLQDFKDQVAREYKVWGLMRMYKDWAEVVQRGMCFQQVSILERAATLFAEHERKEAYKEGRKDGLKAYIDTRYEDTNIHPRGMAGDSELPAAKSEDAG
jgi:hypothetical protein